MITTSNPHARSMIKRSNPHFSKSSPLNYFTPRRRRSTFWQSRFQYSPESPWNRCYFPTCDDCWTKFLQQAALLDLDSTDPWKLWIIDGFYSLQPLVVNKRVDFRRAACALESCTKLYSLRVKSLVTNFGSFLSSLDASYGSAPKQKRYATKNERVELESVAIGSPQVASPLTRRARQRAPAPATVVQSFDKIKLKKPDVSSVSDPLFLNTLTEFIDCSSRCMFLNTLSLDERGLKVFDKCSALLINSDNSQEGAVSETVKQPEKNVRQVSLRSIYKHLFLENNQDIIDTLTISATIRDRENKVVDFSDPDSVLSVQSTPKSVTVFDDEPQDYEVLEYGRNFQSLSDTESSHSGYFQNYNQDINLDFDVSMQSDISNHTLVPNTLVSQCRIYSNSPQSQVQEHWRIRQTKNKLATRGKSTTSAKKKRLDAAEMRDLNKYLNNTSEVDFVNCLDDVDIADYPAFIEGHEDNVFTLPKSGLRPRDKNLLDWNGFVEALDKVFMKPTVSYDYCLSWLKNGPEDVPANSLSDLNTSDCFDEAHCSFEYVGDTDFWNYDYADSGAEETSPTIENDVYSQLSCLEPVFENPIFYETPTNLDFKELKTVIKHALETILPRNNNTSFHSAVFDNCISPNSDSSFSTHKPAATLGTLIKATIWAYASLSVERQQHRKPFKNTVQNVSTATCFLALLVIASENGLVLENTPDYQDIMIKNKSLDYCDADIR